MIKKTVTEQKQEITHNDLVWAKVTGHPWWPGIAKFEPEYAEKKFFRVDFFGDPPTHSILPSSKIIKYETYQKDLNHGRASPELKRAIHQASILFTTIQESKYTQDALDHSKRPDPLENNLLFSPVSHIVERAPPLPRKDKIICENRTLCSEEMLNNISKKKVKLITKKQKEKRKIGLLSRELKKREEKIEKIKQKEYVKKLLRDYRLQNIPHPDKEPVNTNNLLAKKLYKILRQKMGAEESRRKAIESLEIIKSGEDLRAFIKTCLQ